MHIGLRRLAAGVAVLAGLGLSAGAANASADPFGHVDLVFEPVCDANGRVTDGEFLLEEHEVGPLQDQDFVFAFDGTDDTDLGFEVEWGGDCVPTTVGVRLTGVSGSGGSFAAGTVFSGSAPSSPGATGPLMLNAGNAYHGDPGAWTVSAGQTFDLTFTFSAAGGTPVASSLPLHISG